MVVFCPHRDGNKVMTIEAAPESLKERAKQENSVVFHCIDCGCTVFIKLENL